ncbi:hypothetical protein [Streptomyces sp. NBC_01262]|uniref:hypothetical protein n=1 Tax=Streptomyces sp. NBC_01262 TaxID=2903803 RepID=UPI002E338A48|nr:hypothetical protein [Streptomyces sp. NBC_01262]
MSARLTSALATVGIATSLLVAVPVSGASAADPICDRGSTKLTWTDVSKTWVVTHKLILENYTGGTATKTFTVKKIDEVTASVKATVGAKVSASVAIASIEENVSLELMASGKHTSESSESVQWTLSKNGDYVLYSGTKKVVGYYTNWRCDAGTKWIKTGQYGKTQSWTVAVDGGVRCAASPGKKTLAYAVKKKYC